MNKKFKVIEGGKTKSAPPVYRIHLELELDHQNREDMIILRDYAKVRKGITRDVLVSSEMTLHALHYVINRVFGWENSHLHHFMLPDEAFQRLTGGTNAPVEFGYTEYDGSFDFRAERSIQGWERHGIERMRQANRGS